MTTTSDIRQKLQHKLDHLPDSQIEEVLRFVNNLSIQLSQSPASNINQFDSKIDPLSEVIGAEYNQIKF